MKPRLAPASAWLATLSIVLIVTLALGLSSCGDGGSTAVETPKTKSDEEAKRRSARSAPPKTVMTATTVYEVEEDVEETEVEDDDSHLDDKENPVIKEAAPKGAMQPMLWRVTRNAKEGEDAVSSAGSFFLFGTIHVPDPRVTTLHPDVQRAFDEAHAVYTEVDLTKDMAAQTKALSLPEGTTLKSVISKELYARLDKRLKSIMPVLSPEAIGIPLRPAAWAIVIPQVEMTMKFPGKQPLDAQLAARARSAKKTVAGLEDPREQTAFFTELTDEQNVEVLTAILDAFDKADKENKDPLAELIDMYLKGDVDTMIAYFEAEMSKDTMSKELTTLFQEKLLYQRNVRIAKKISELLHAKPMKNHFFAIGTMHCIGERCVQDTLKKLGYSCERVTGEAETDNDLPRAEAFGKELPAEGSK